MCLITYNKEPYTANKNLVVYKILNKSFFGELISPYMEFKYKLRTLYWSPLHKIESLYTEGLYSIYEGLHAYTSINKAIKNLKYFGRGRVYKCIIPKGSLYYINEDHNEIVSNKLIVKRRLWFNKF